MKQILLFLLLFLSINLSSQGVFDSSLTFHGVTFQYTSCYKNNFRLYYSDTVLKGKTYIKTTKYYCNNGHYFREDSVLRKIFIFDPILDSEFVWLDYNAKVGDTLYKLIVNRIDTIQVLGKSKKKFDLRYLKNPGYFILFVEDVGHVDGVYFMDFECTPTDNGFCISKVMKKDSLIYLDTIGCKCEPIRIKESNQDEFKMRIYDNKISIESQSYPLNAFIFNSLGVKKIEKSHLVTGETIDISKLPKGIYFVEFRDEKDIKIYSQKIMIE